MKKEQWDTPTQIWVSWRLRPFIMISWYHYFAYWPQPCRYESTLTTTLILDIGICISRKNIDPPCTLIFHDGRVISIWSSLEIIMTTPTQTEFPIQGKISNCFPPATLLTTPTQNPVSMMATFIRSWRWHYLHFPSNDIDHTTQTEFSHSAIILTTPTQTCFQWFPHSLMEMSLLTHP